MSIESTDELGRIELEDGVEVPCRIWRGTTERGTHCLLFVTRVAVADKDVNSAEFAELIDHTDCTTTKLLDTRQ